MSVLSIQSKEKKKGQHLLEQHQLFDILKELSRQAS